MDNMCVYFEFQSTNQEQDNDFFFKFGERSTSYNDGSDEVTYR